MTITVTSKARHPGLLIVYVVVGLVTMDTMGVTPDQPGIRLCPGPSGSPCTSDVLSTLSTTPHPSGANLTLGFQLIWDTSRGVAPAPSTPNSPSRVIGCPLIPIPVPPSSESHWPNGTLLAMACISLIQLPGLSLYHSLTSFLCVCHNSAILSSTDKSCDASHSTLFNSSAESTTGCPPSCGKVSEPPPSLRSSSIQHDQNFRHKKSMSLASSCTKKPVGIYLIRHLTHSIIQS